MDIQKPSFAVKSFTSPLGLVAKTKTRSPPIVEWQHQWTADVTKDALSESSFQKLPTEIMLHIFRYLSVTDLGQVSLVCRAFKVVADQDEIWKHKCNTAIKLMSKSFKEIYMDWMYEKYLRNQELEEVEAQYNTNRVRYACGLRCPPPQYPLRPDGNNRFELVGGFTEHPNKSNNIMIQLSVDVDKTAHELISLLTKASKFQYEWRESTVIKQMITRYYRFLQLKATHPTVLLVPTLDIEMMWQTHLLRPSMYQNDCQRLFHRVIDHSLLAVDIEQFLKKQAFLDTCKLYRERFGDEYCSLPRDKEGDPKKRKYEHHPFSSLKCLIPVYSYWDQSHFKFSKTEPRDFENPFSFTEADFILDGNWLNLCQRFMNKAESKLHQRRPSAHMDEINLGSGPMRRLMKSYERFLYMSSKYPPSAGYPFVHPTYAIDIIWHSHMQEPLNYDKDCKKLVGYLIDHAPWPSVDEKKMEQSCNELVKAWEKEFQVKMSMDHLYNTAEDIRDYWDY